MTRAAEESLTEIARWTFATFGPRQAAAHEDVLIAPCHAIAAGTALSQDCRRLIDPTLPEDLRFARADQFIVFVENTDQVIIVDVLHSRSDLLRGIADLPGLAALPDR